MIDSNQAPSQVPATISAARDAALQIVDPIFDGDWDKGLDAVVDQLRVLAAKPQDSNTTTLQGALEATGHFFHGYALVRKGSGLAAFAEARDRFYQAAEGFRGAELDDYRDMAVALAAYSEAMTQLQAKNVGRALELYVQLKQYLENAQRFSQKFEPIIELMEPEFTFLRGVSALLELDFARGQAEISRASEAAEKVAARHFAPGTPLNWTFRGMARYYKAYWTLTWVRQRFSEFDYDRVTERKDLADDAVQAQEMLSKGDPSNALLRSFTFMASGIASLLGSMAKLAPLMVTVLHSTFKADLAALQGIRGDIQAAQEAFARAGDPAAELIRFCGEFSKRVDNLERIARPSTKDLGIFGGLVACALFLVLFLVVSWANGAFSIGLSAATVASTCLVMSLIGGFGYGAVRFKSLLSFTKGSSAE